MAVDDFGSALTGQSAGGDIAGLTQQWDDFLQRPGNRQALLQIGLNLMQPVGFGQTTGGHIAQAIGAGGEAVDRSAALDLKERMADAKLEDADARLEIAQQNANANTSRANTAARRLEQAGSKKGGLTEAFRARAARQDAQNFDRQLERDAKAIAKQVSDAELLGGSLSPDLAKYKGQSVIQIREDLRKSRPAPKYGNVPTNEDDTEDDNDTQRATPTPPTRDSRLAPDGTWYRPDPANPGKFLRWNGNR